MTITRLFSRFFQHFDFYIQRCPERPFIRFLKNYYCGPRQEGLVGVEIGVRGANNALNILKYLPIKKLYLIDPYKNYSREMGSQEKLDKASLLAHLKLQKYKNVVWLCKFSDVAHKEILEGLDFAYIDGNHKYDFVKQDIENYYPLLKSGGILAGHDINHKDVLLAFADFVREKKLLSRVISPDWLIIKT